MVHGGPALSIAQKKTKLITSRWQHGTQGRAIQFHPQPRARLLSFSPLIVTQAEAILAPSNHKGARNTALQTRWHPFPRNNSVQESPPVCLASKTSSEAATLTVSLLWFCFLKPRGCSAFHVIPSSSIFHSIYQTPEENKAEESQLPPLTGT